LTGRATDRGEGDPGRRSLSTAGWMPGSETATRGDGQHAEETRSIAISHSSSRSRPDEAGRGRRGRRRPFSPAKPALERAAKARQSGLGGRAHPEASFSATRLRRETAGSGERCRCRSHAPTRGQILRRLGTRTNGCRGTSHA